tara:strand:- start:1432 stop:2157 length:726 start_codon:yes stop_codon:yes gene_type:complete
MINLKNKIALVVGGSGLIGTQITKKLLDNKAIVISTFNSSKSKIQNRKNLYSEKLNVLREKDLDIFFLKLKKKFKRIDILINCLGINNPNDFDKINGHEWDKILDVNLKGPFLILQKSLPLLKKSRSASVINISSVSGQYGGPRTAHYAVSKAGLISLTQVFARFVAKFKIRCNTVSPGFINSKMAKKAKNSKKVNQITKNILLSRFGDASEVANLCTYLSSDKSSYITGQVININGGLYF